MTNILMAGYYIALIACLFVSIWNYSRFEQSIKIIVWLVGLAVAVEVAVYLLFHCTSYGKSPGYHVYNPIEAILVSVFFTRTVRWRIGRSGVFLIAVFWVGLASLNVLYLQPITILNSNFLTAESFLILVMSLFSMYKILIDESIERVVNYPFFWLWVCFFLYFSCTFFFWTTIKTLQFTKYNNMINYFQIIVNVVTYLGIACIFYFYPKLIRK